MDIRETPDEELPGRELPLEESIEEVEIPKETPKAPTSKQQVVGTDVFPVNQIEKTEQETPEPPKPIAQTPKPKRTARPKPPIAQVESAMSQVPGKKRKGSAETKTGKEGQPEDGETVPKKPRGGVPATFARRNLPTSDFGKMKWNSLRDAFGEILKPKLTFYSAQEDH